jgi:hypothetical protein
MKNLVLILILTFSSVVSLNNRQQCRDPHAGKQKVDQLTLSNVCLTPPAPNETTITDDHCCLTLEASPSYFYNTLNDTLTDSSQTAALDDLSPNKSTPEKTDFLTSIKTLLKNGDIIWFALMNFYRQKLISVLKEQKKTEFSTFKINSDLPASDPRTLLLCTPPSSASQNIYHTIK